MAQRGPLLRPCSPNLELLVSSRDLMRLMINILVGQERFGPILPQESDQGVIDFLLTFLPMIGVAVGVGILTFPFFYLVEKAVPPPHWIKNAFPLLFTIFLILWTLVVSPHSGYGDKWAIMPAAIVLPVVFAWHVFLVILRKTLDKKAKFLLFGIIHVVLLVPIWFLCLMLISKDSL